MTDDELSTLRDRTKKAEELRAKIANTKEALFAISDAIKGSKASWLTDAFRQMAEEHPRWAGELLISALESRLADLEKQFKEL